VFLVRLGQAGAERPAVRTDDGTVYDLSSVTGDFDGAFFAGDGVDRARDALATGRLPVLDASGLRTGAPVVRPGAVICIGQNYAAHAAESGAESPTSPIIFFKHPNTVVGPYDDVAIPPGSVKTDWEVELAVVIGKTARYLESPAEALGYVAGYAVCNDVSEREFQIERGGQWDKGKSCETFNPLGPWLVPASEVADPQDLALKTWVNGELKQDSSTKDMIFTVAEIVHYLSRFMVLRPGDVINTGTPQGVALGQPEPKPYLRAGDVVELEIEGLGRQRQTFGQA
jgi:2-keto-4-pentenoate hydratase/2-oxohepta-3-ene-1,7-dioic acid hydratase in catechol pathway